jgi:hypothetical protein
MSGGLAGGRPSRRRDARPHEDSRPRRGAVRIVGAEGSLTPTRLASSRRRSDIHNFAAKRRKPAADRPRDLVWRGLIRPGENAARRV